MRTKKMFLALFVLALLTTAVFASRPKGYEKGPMMGDHPMLNQMIGDRMPGLKIQFLGILLKAPAVQKDLGLSKIKADKIQTIITENKKFNIKQKADKEVLLIDLREEMEKDTIDEVKVKELAGKINQISGDIFLRNTIDNAKALNMLTPDQKSKLKELGVDRRNQMKNNFKKHWKKMRK